MKRGLKVIYMLSKNQQEILELVSVNNLTPKAIAKRRGITVQAVYKTISKLRKKGYLEGGGLKLYPPLPKTPHWRLHGVQFNIKINPTHGYNKALKHSNLIIRKNCTVRLHKQSINVFSGLTLSFIGKEPKETDSKMIEHFIELFHKLERELNIIILKERKQNVKLVSSHYAYVVNGIDKFLMTRKFTLFTNGKAWFTRDNSWQQNELETIHPQDSREHAEVLGTHFNDLIENNPPTLSQVATDLDKVKAMLELNTLQQPEIKPNYIG